MNSLMTIKEAADYLKLNHMTVYKLAQKNKIPAFKVGGNWRFKREILEEWLASQSTMNRGTVLVVDDDVKIQEILREIISDNGYKAVTVRTGEEAVKQVAKQHFDLILLDLVLPGLDGVEALQAIKEKDENAVIVIVTGYGDDPIALRAISLGPLLLVRKPIRITDIVEVLNMAMKKSY
jgi:excisionase family DNA binding protein